MAAYVLRERLLLGRVRTPYGRKMRYSPWTTVGRYSTLEEARIAMRSRRGLFEFRASMEDSPVE